MSECKNNYSNNEIEKYFGESDESIKKCNSCPNFIYEDGMMQCKKNTDSYNNERK